MQSNFPPLFGAYHHTELLAALHRYGPIRVPILRRHFSWVTCRYTKGKMNTAGLLVPVRVGDQARKSTVIGINANLPVYDQFARLIDALAMRFPIRAIPKEIRPAEVAAFYGVTHSPANIEALFGTFIRTRTLVALHALDGEETSGKLKRAVLGHFASRVQNAVLGCVAEGVLIKEKTIIRFNTGLDWLPELRALLESLARLMPENVKYARTMRALSEKDSSARTREAKRFRFLGSRVNQAALAYLAVYGPSAITVVCAAASSTQTKCVETLLQSGIVAQIPSQNKRRRIVSLNASHPVYRELRALLRTDIVLQDALPFHRQPSLYAGEDYGDVRRDFEPYTLFGGIGKFATTNLLAVLGHAIHGEIEVASLSRILNEHDIGKLHEALKRLEGLGVVAAREWKGMRMYRLDETWPAFEQLRELLLAMGRVWPEYRDGAASEIRTYPAFRRSRERGRVSRRARL